MALHQHLALRGVTVTVTITGREGHPPPGMHQHPQPSPGGSRQHGGSSRASSGRPGWAGTGRRGRAPHASVPPARAAGPGTGTAGTAPSGTCGEGRLSGSPPARSPPPVPATSPAGLAVDAAAVPAAAAPAGVGGAAEGPLDALGAAGTRALAPRRPRRPAAVHCQQWGAPGQRGSRRSLPAVAMPPRARTHRYSRGFGGSAAVARPGRCRGGSSPSPAALAGTAAPQPGRGTPAGVRTGRCRHPAPAPPRTSTLPRGVSGWVGALRLASCPLQGEGSPRSPQVPPSLSPPPHLGCRVGPAGTWHRRRGRCRTRGRGHRTGATAPRGRRRRWGSPLARRHLGREERGQPPPGAHPSHRDPPVPQSPPPPRCHPPISRAAGDEPGSSVQWRPPFSGGRQSRRRSRTPPQPPVQLDQVAHSLQAPSTAGRRERSEGGQPLPAPPCPCTPWHPRATASPDLCGGAPLLPRQPWPWEHPGPLGQPIGVI